MAESDLAEMESLARSRNWRRRGCRDAGPINPFEFNEAEVRKDFEAYRSNWG
jgi:hypothetical protein